MKCNNCDAQATYFFASFGAATQYFCEPCVPWSLQDRLSAGELSKIEDITAPFEPAPLEEPVVEEAPVEPAPTQTKSKKTKTAVVEDVLPDTADTVDSNVPNN
jgi:hypothetical protein